MSMNHEYLKKLCGPALFCAVFLFSIAVAGCSTGPGESTAPAASKAPASDAQVASAAAVVAANSVEVCMVTDRVMDKPQIPVEVEGKTYYGCCMGCVARLKNDRSLRYAVDPVTGREVDKSKAFIVKAPGGGAVYFESAETAAKFSAAGGV